MNTIILVIVLISGYLYVINAVSARYKFKRSEGWEAYFHVAVCGVIFTTIAWLLCSILSMSGIFRWIYNSLLTNNIITNETINRVFPLSTANNASSNDIGLAVSPFKFADVKFAIFCISSMMLAWLSGLSIKWYTCRNMDSRIDALVKVVYNDPLESLLIEASVRCFPVIITLNSRKFYVGLVECPKFEHGKVDSLQLVPLLSGYRSKEELTINITTNYKRHYVNNGIRDEITDGQLSLSDFRVLVPYKGIESISFFDPETYSIFKEKEVADKKECTKLNSSYMGSNKDSK
ncbi:hypothetical protein [Arsenophonus nasoniae]|uniref:Uncharacterized protein n=1 Tax=Arsenophonus nasoniae TaxID=638 RepID=A0AA95GAW3_9GAMM|nr:hypothetical protein [Arsenophonus nasoniae]WGL95586.1 hypothetical protein QE207_02885 [Arsenophonus nasoniae]